MLSRTVVVAGALLLGACSKSNPDTSAKAGTLGTASPAVTHATATVAPNQAANPPGALVADQDGPTSQPMPMDGGHMHDGGMHNGMPGHPMMGSP